MTTSSLPDGRPDSLGQSEDARSVEVTLSAEQLATGTEWVESGHVRLRRRVVSEKRILEVEVRREELIIEVRGAAAGPVGESYVGTVLDGPAVAAPGPVTSPLVVLLREEVPEVVMRPRPYERVTAETVMSTGIAIRRDSLRHEEVVTETVHQSERPADQRIRKES